MAAMVSKRCDAWFRKGSVTQGRLPQLTAQEAEVYALWSQEYQTPTQIACRLKISDSMVRRYIRNIKSKGYVLNMVPGVPKTGTTPEPSAPQAGQVRLHGQHFVVSILHASPVYSSLRSRSNVQYLEGVTVKLHREKVEFIASQELSFFGSCADKATAVSMGFWSRFFHKMESHLGVVLLKPRSQNIKVVSAHYERMNCGLAKKVLEEGRSVRVFSREDGKLWFVMDRSLGLTNSECLHPDSAQRDMADIVEPLMNDWKAHADRLMLPSELQLAVQNLIKHEELIIQMMQASAASQQVFSEYLKAQVPLESRAGGRLKVERPDYVG